MAAFQSLLRPQFLTKVVSQVAGTSDWLATLFGVQPGGKNILNYGHGRTGFFNIYDHVRKAARGRAPGTAAARRSIQPMGTVNFSYPRMHDSVSMPAEWLHNLGRLDNPAMQDRAGEDMIRRQTGTLGELAANWRKAMLVGLLRDTLYLGVDGDDVFFDFEATSGVLPVFPVNARMPAGNKSQLDMLGDGDIINASWATSTTNIPLHLTSINAAFQQLCGGHLSAVICSHVIWNHILANDHVQERHGTANPAFTVLERDALEPEIAKTMANVYRAKLNFIPDVTFYITDEGLEVGAPGSESFTKLVPEDKAMFIGHRPDDGTLGCYEGSEPIAEYDAGPETVKVGLSSWSVKRSNPTTTDLFVLDNALAVNHVPNSHALGTVVF